MNDWHLPSTTDAFHSLLKEQEYQKNTREQVFLILKSHGCKFRNCIDGGAHVGTWSIDLVKHFNWVYAFEPIKELNDCFKKNITAKNYTLYNTALSSHTGTTTFLYDQSNTGDTFATSEGNIECECVCIDELDFKDIDYIKLDCEGMEEKVLEGAVKTLYKHRPILQLEMKNKNLKNFQTNKNNFRKKIEALGYKRVAKIVNEEIFVYIGI
jgi:FkbM family methyltransferase|tara:strand:+ start:75 stop:707 length:633 start_codon:yes stop_codon:yes gene_type:complete